MHLVNITPDDALDRAKWQKVCKQADPAQMQKKKKNNNVFLDI